MIGMDCLTTCCPTSIGYTGNGWGGGIVECGSWPVILGVRDVISKLPLCGNVFAGLQAGFCNDYKNFLVPDWPTVLQWIKDGGRLTIIGDFNYGAPVNLDCFGPVGRADANAFLTAMGSSIQFSAAATTDTLDNCRYATGSTIPLLSGLLGVSYDDAGSVTGGSSMGTKLEAGGGSIGAIEAIGSGFLMAVADTNIFTSCRTQNCGWIRRWVEEDDPAKIL